MKKISLIAGLAMLVTVGGVFAAWQFGGYDTDDGAASIGVSVDSDVVTLDEASITLEKAAKYSIKFAQHETEQQQYFASEFAGVGDTPFTASVVNNSGAAVNYTIAATVTHSLSEEEVGKLTVYMNFAKVLTDIDALFDDAGTVNHGANHTITVTEAEIVTVFNDNVKPSTITDAAKVTEFNGLVQKMAISIALHGELS